VETAVAVSRATTARSTSVVVASAGTYADALAGAPLAARADAPLLLTGGDGLHPATAAEVRRLGARRAYLLGGSAALSDAVADGLRQAGVTEVVRVSGPDRAGTAAAVSGRLQATGHAFLALGWGDTPAQGWPDALAASALAGTLTEPILLTAASGLPEATRRALADEAVERVTIVGGTAAVPQAVEAELADMGIAVDRLAGPNRLATSLAAADAHVAAGAEPARVWLAQAGNWPDALAAGPAAARTGQVLLLVDGQHPDSYPDTYAWLDEHGLESARVLGGPDVVRPTILQRLNRSP
jgi:putative cell wall-binding protein